MRIVDAHHHLWDPSAVRYSLLDGKGRLAPLTRPFLSAAFDAVAMENNIAEAIAVEAASAGADPEIETRWLLDEADRSRISKRVAAYAPVERMDIADYLDRLLGAAGGDRIVGIRRSFESAPAGFMTSPEVLVGIRQVAARNLVFDLVLFADRLAEAVDLVRRVPEAEFVLDHLGKPAIGGAVSAAWQRDIAAMAELPNVTAKVSGLITETGAGSWTAEAIRPYVEHAVASFGWNRLMFGSDWPVCELAGGYRRWLDFTRSAAAGATLEERRAFFAGTADRVYRARPTAAWSPTTRRRSSDRSR